MKQIFPLSILIFTLISCVSSFKNPSESELEHIVFVLDTIFENDQKYRLKMSYIEDKFGNESDEMYAVWDTIRINDSLNLIEVTTILDTYGWLGPDKIGRQGNTTLFLVIQHSDSATREKYLPVMREAVEDRNANPPELALLVDRVALRRGEKQIFGSQIGWNNETSEYYVLPLIDPINVDQRRTEVGLPPFADYCSLFDIQWNIDQYIEDISKNNRE